MSGDIWWSGTQSFFDVLFEWFRNFENTDFSIQLYIDVIYMYSNLETYITRLFELLDNLKIKAICYWTVKNNDIDRIESIEEIQTFTTIKINVIFKQ
jgi:hypothetical protein